MGITFHLCCFHVAHLSCYRSHWKNLLSDPSWLTVKRACFCLAPMTQFKDPAQVYLNHVRRKCVHAASSGLNMAAGRAFSAILVHTISISKEHLQCSAR